MEIWQKKYKVYIISSSGATCGIKWVKKCSLCQMDALCDEEIEITFYVRNYYWKNK